MTTPTVSTDGARTVREEVWNDSGRCSLRAELIVEAPDVETGRRFAYRVRVSRNAYDFQSYASCEVLTATGWAEVVRRCDITRLPIARHSYTSRAVDEWKADMLHTVGIVMAEGRRLWEQVQR